MVAPKLMAIYSIVVRMFQSGPKCPAISVAKNHYDANVHFNNGLVATFSMQYWVVSVQLAL